MSKIGEPSTFQALINLIKSKMVGQDTIAEEFSTSEDYTAGTIVLYDNTIYIFDVDHSAGPWDPEEVTETSIAELIENGGGGGSSALENDITASVTVGGITSGTTLQAGKTFEDIFKDMLDPVAYPTLTAPSASLSGTGSKLLEVGATLAVTLTATLNRGSINPAYGTSGYRSGAATGYSLNGEDPQQSNTFSETVSGSNNTFYADISYAAGEQPKNSKGGNYDSPLPAGSVRSGNVVYKFVNAMWANTANIAMVAKLSLIDNSSTKQRDMVFPAQTVANPEVFDIPASWTVTAVQVKNDLSGQYEDASDQFTITDTTHDDAAGTSVAYKRYSFNKGFDTGARTVRVKWS